MGDTAQTFIPVKSSWVEAIGPYDSKTKSFQVRLKGGELYSYPARQAEYDNLRSAESIGSHINKHFRERKVSRYRKWLISHSQRSSEA